MHFILLDCRQTIHFGNEMSNIGCSIPSQSFLDVKLPLNKRIIFMYYDQNIVRCVQIFMAILFQVFGCWRMIEIKVLYCYKMFFFPTFSITCASNIPFIFISHDYKPMHNWFPGKSCISNVGLTMFPGRVIDTISVFHLLKIIWSQQ